MKKRKYGRNGPTKLIMLLFVLPVAVAAAYWGAIYIEGLTSAPAEATTTATTTESTIITLVLTEAPPTTLSTTTEATTPETTIEVIKYPEVVDEWALILVNSESPLPDDFSVELGNINPDFQCDARILDAINDFWQAGRNRGLNLILLSSYRTKERSAYLFEVEVKANMDAGMSRTEAERTAAGWIARPGTSEHHTGLAFDIIDHDFYFEKGFDNEFAQTEAGKWLRDHCAEYGFILRFPEGKTSVTNINFESWHFRYVGADHAKYIMENDLCLEEYLELLGR